MRNGINKNSGAAQTRRFLKRPFFPAAAAAFCAAAFFFPACEGASDVSNPPSLPDKPRYDIYYIAPENGSITGPPSAREGEKVTVTVSANAGFKFDGALYAVNEEDKALKVSAEPNACDQYAFTMPAERVRVLSGMFLQEDIVTYGISYTPPVNGSFSGPALAAEGTAVEVRIIPDEGFAFDGKMTAISAGGSPVTITITNGVYAFIMPAERVSVSGGAFIPAQPAVKYDIHYMPSDANGSFSGPSFAEEGATVEVNVIPNAGYKFRANMTVTRSSGGTSAVTRTGESYTFTMPPEGVTVAGGFVLSQFENMADGGEVFFVETAENVFDEVHVFKFIEGNKAGLQYVFDNGQTLHTFTAKHEISGAKALILGGGGGGGKSTNWNWRAGGGGAGGLLLGSNITITSGAHTVKVGGGGAGGLINGSYQDGTNGKASEFNGIQAAGGGGGGKSQVSNGATAHGNPGGSGGGGTGKYEGGAAVPVIAEGYTFYGHKGGDGAGRGGGGTSPPPGGGGRNYGGGGGGAGAAGEKGGDGNHNGSIGGKGGKGLNWVELGGIINAGLLGLSGDLYGLAGGGFGSSSAEGAEDNGAGYGGGLTAYLGWVNANGFFTESSVGATRRDNSAVKDGIAGTGGGGGGGAIGSDISPGNGGSGLVVIRFPYTAPPAPTP